MIERLRPDLQRAIQPFLGGLREGSYNGNLEAATAVRLVSLLRYATGVLPLESYELESGKIGAPSAVIGDLLDALNSGIDELTRPVDAVKHQAKTVTVGISRSEDALFGVPLVKTTLVGRRRSRHPGLPGPADARRPGRGGGRGGRLHPLPHRLARHRRHPPSPSSTRAASRRRCPLPEPPIDPRLLGTKHRAAEEREVTVARGRQRRSQL